jgi:uncharacterized membrane protein
MMDGPYIVRLVIWFLLAVLFSLFAIGAVAQAHDGDTRYTTWEYVTCAILIAIGILPAYLFSIPITFAILWFTR